MTALQAAHIRTEDVVEFTVYGTPKPKGSLRHVGRGRLVEQLEGSPVWREAVKYAALAARWGTIAGFQTHFPPMTGPLAVNIVATVAKPKSAPKTRRTWPVTRSSGDIDKIARNCLDAVVDAGLIGDDSQVIELSIAKCYPGEHQKALDVPGAAFHIQRIDGAI